MKVVIIVFLVFAIGHMAFAQFITSQQIGDFTFTSGTDASGNPIDGSSIRIGDSVFHNYNFGNGQTANGSTLNIGETAFHNVSLSDGTTINGTSQHFGNLGFHNFSDSNGYTANSTSMAIGDTTFNYMNVLGGWVYSFETPQAEKGRQQQSSSFVPAKFTFGEVPTKNNSSREAQSTTPLFDSTSGRITAAGILVSPSEKTKTYTPGPTLDEMYAKVAAAVKNKQFVMIAKISEIYDNTHRVLLDTCDVVEFTTAEYKNIRGKWKVGDIVTVSEWVDDKGNFVNYEFEVYGLSSAHSNKVE